MQFPQHYPTQCPPVDSMDASGRFYRLVQVGKPIEDSFISLWILRSKKHSKRKRSSWLNDGEACKACGLSINSDIDMIKKKLRIVPSLRKKFNRIALINMTPEMGKIKQTPSDNDADHHTWWIPSSIDNPSVYVEELLCLT